MGVGYKAHPQAQKLLEFGVDVIEISNIDNNQTDT